MAKSWASPGQASPSPHQQTTWYAPSDGRLNAETAREEVASLRTAATIRRLGLEDLIKNDHFVTLLRAEKLDALPKYLSEMIKMTVRTPKPRSSSRYLYPLDKLLRRERPATHAPVGEVPRASRVVQEVGIIEP